MGKFELGQTVITPGATELLEAEGKTATEFLVRHHSGDWGTVSESDKKLNDSDVNRGGQLLSAYELPTGKIWIITEGNRSATTILLPSEY